MVNDIWSGCAWIPNMSSYCGWASPTNILSLNLVVNSPNRYEEAKKSRSSIVFHFYSKKMRSWEANLPIVWRWETIGECFFFLFFKEIRMEKRDRELLEMFLIVGNWSAMPFAFQKKKRNWTKVMDLWLLVAFTQAWSGFVVLEKWVQLWSHVHGWWLSYLR